jgi:ligand-binding sensor domain-containing protein/signal transduction histidine kinase
MRGLQLMAAGVVMAALPSSAALALPPEKALTQFVLDAWDLEDGLPQISVHAVVRTQDGFLWFATEEGLVRFDGAALRTYDTSNTPALGHNSIWALLEDRHGTLWIGTYGGGLTSLRDGALRTITTKDGLPSNSIRTLHEDKGGALWAGTDGGGLVRIENETRITTFTSHQGLPDDRVNAIAEDSAGALWIGTDGGGLARLQDGVFTSYTSRQGLPDDEVNAVFFDRDGTLWAGTDSGLARFDHGVFTRFTKRDGLPEDWITDILQDRDGSLWVATTGGVCRMRGGRFEALTSRQGLPNDRIITLYEDAAGSLWFGTAGGGLGRLKDAAAMTFGPPEGLSYDITSTILEDRRGALWIGTYGGGLNRLHDGRTTTFRTKDGLPDDAITALLEDRGGTLWVGTRRGLCRFAGSSCKPVGSAEAASRAPVRALAEGADGSLWIGTYGAGVLRLRDGRFTHHGRDSGLSHEYVQSLYLDRAGTLWAGTDGGGLNRLDGDRFVHVGQADGGPVNILSFLETPQGDMWVGTDGGLCRLDGERLACFGPRAGLVDIVYRILEDGSGNLWLSCNKGVIRVARRDLDDLAAGRRATIDAVSYGRADGMRSVECNGGVQPAGWRTRDGGLWFPTIAGAVRFDPNRAVAKSPAPPLVIERALIDGREAGAGAGVPPGRGDLEFHYAALDLLDAHRVVYRYRLEGFDDDWIAAGARRIAYYTHVPPGRYRFQVTAARSDGAWEAATASFPFELRPRFIQTVWFYALVALAGCAAAWGLSRVRVRSLEARQAERHREEARQRQADFVSGVSHELKTPLTLIRLYGETLQYGEAASEREQKTYCDIIVRESERLTRLIERVLDFSRVDRGEKRYQIGPGDLASVIRDTIGIYGQSLKRQGFQVEVAVESRLPVTRFDPDAVVDALLNLVDNAAKYAGDAKYVGIRVRSEGNRVVCEVEDRGQGIPPDDREHLFRKFHRGRNAAGKGGHGLGLFLVKHVMDAHGGRVDVESAPNRGTRIRLVFPAAEPAA